MNIGFLVAASLFAVPASAVQDSSISSHCKPMDVMMGARKAEPIKPERPPEAVLPLKPQTENTGPAVLIPNCKTEPPQRRRKNDHPLA